MNFQVNKEVKAREEFTPQKWMYSQYIKNYNEINSIYREELILSLIIATSTKITKVVKK